MTKVRDDASPCDPAARAGRATPGSRDLRRRLSTDWIKESLQIQTSDLAPARGLFWHQPPTPTRRGGRFCEAWGLDFDAPASAAGTAAERRPLLAAGSTVFTGERAAAERTARSMRAL